VPSLHGALDGVAGRAPDSPALAWRATTWSYSDLRAAIAVVENALRARNLERGTRIALLLRNSPQYVAAYYGTLAAGCVVVPLNVQERAPVLERQIEDSESSLVLADSQHPEWSKLSRALQELAIDVVELRLHDGADTVSLLRADLSASPAPLSRRGRAADPELASIIYTSGTTGSPKGVMLSHGNLHANAMAIVRSLALSARDHSLCVLPFHFSYGNSVLHSHLLCGARLTIEDTLAFPHLMLQRMQTARVSGFAGVPSTFALLLGRHRLRDFDLRSLRYVTQAGGPMPRPLLDELRAALPNVRIFLMYGQTEAAARLTCLPPEDLDRKPGSVGLPVEGVELEIRSDGRAAERGNVGEIFARGPNVMLGYWANPVATAEVLADGWLRTRDLGKLDEDGYLYIVGRASDMIKVGAFRVSPQEIEEVLAGIEGIEEAAVTGVPDDVLGQVVKAVIVLRAGAQTTEMAVKAHCREHLASYKVPKTVDFVASLPKTSSGKIQRFKLIGTESSR
jgi:acyl-CoA synthetase (AMP-forming)/AMP-acid ligase II